MPIDQDKLKEFTDTVKGLEAIPQNRNNPNSTQMLFYKKFCFSNRNWIGDLYPLEEPSQGDKPILLAEEEMNRLGIKKKKQEKIYGALSDYVATLKQLSKP